MKKYSLALLVLLTLVGSSWGQCCGGSCGGGGMGFMPMGMPFVPMGAFSPVCPCGVNCSCTAGQCGAIACPSYCQLTIYCAPDAVLTLDGHATTSTGRQRVFQTPPLECGKTYEYIVGITTTEDGKRRTRSYSVLVWTNGNLHYRCD